MKLLLVEDEVGITRVLRRGLEMAHFEVDIAQDGKKGLEMALSQEYSLIILDLMLPGMDGREICKELRVKRRTTPILMLTALSTLSDRVNGLETGADDYLCKPFEFPELLARVQALLRRDKIHKGRNIRILDLNIDTQLHYVERNGSEIPLSQREYLLLEALATNEGRVLSRETIQERVWMDEDSYSNVVDVYIGLLRKKIDAGSDIKLIHTVRGLGYSLRRPEEDKEAERV